MRRREFITLLGGVAAAWPLTARAQQREGMRRIGMLTGIRGEDTQTKARIAAFLQKLQKLGWTEGRNVRMDIRAGAGNLAATRKYAAELVALAPDVIVASGTTPVTVLLETTHTVPIVFTIVIDPIGAGFINKLSRPGGNATGFMEFDYSLSGKWVVVRGSLERLIPLNQSPDSVLSESCCVGVVLWPRVRIGKVISSCLSFRVRSLCFRPRQNAKRSVFTRSI
jgi:hypothetical protein